MQRPAEQKGTNPPLLLVPKALSPDSTKFLRLTALSDFDSRPFGKYTDGKSVQLSPNRLIQHDKIRRDLRLGKNPLQRPTGASSLQLVPIIHILHLLVVVTKTPPTTRACDLLR